MPGRGPYVVCAPLTAGEAQAFLAVPGSNRKGWCAEPLDPAWQRGQAAEKLRGASPQPEPPNNDNRSPRQS